MLNVYVNWFVTFHLTKSQFLDTHLLSVDDFRMVIAVCQVAGSLLCLTIVDFIERKVNVMTVKIQKILIIKIIVSLYLNCSTYW